MFGTLKTLITGAEARATEHVRDAFSIELIDQKIREAEASLRSAKYALASLMQRARTEARQIADLEGRIVDLTARATQALEADRADLARHAAQAIADMENELSTRRSTADRLEGRIAQLRQSVETANRRLIDLKQGAIAARAAKKEMAVQRRLGAHVAQATAFEEAEELIARVLNKDDPFEQSQILSQIDDSLSHTTAAETLAEAGFGQPTKSTADAVLARLTQ